jgi:hypothetical protein
MSNKLIKKLHIGWMELDFYDDRKNEITYVFY